MTKHRSSLGYLCLCFASLVLASSVAKAHTFTTIPSTPKESSPVQLYVEGYSGVSTPWYLYTFAIAGKTITVNACEPPGFSTPSPYNFLVNLGVLGPGTYSVRYYVYDCGPPSQMGVPSSPRFVTGYSFQVFANTPSQLTIVPSLSGTGTTLLTISGPGNACYQLDATSFTIASGVITLHTASHGAATCFPEPPPSTITVVKDVGLLSPGPYTVNWIFDPPLDTILPPTSLQFNAIGAGAPIPTLGSTTLLLLLGSMGVLGMVALRKRHRS